MGTEAGLESPIQGGSDENTEVPQNGVPQQDSSGGNPAWSTLLDKLPAGLHGLVRPELETWDRNVQQKLQQVHSQYEPYKPFIDSRVDPRELDSAYQIFNLINSDPRAFYDQMANFYGWTDEQGQEQQSQDEEDAYDLSGDEDDPRLSKLEQAQQQLQQTIEQQMQAQAQAEADSQLDQTMTSLKQKFGEFDEGFVLTKAMQYMNTTGREPNLEQIVQEYQQFVDGVRQQPRAGANAPRVLPTSGGVPSSNVDPTSLSPKDRRALMAEMLQKANTEG